MDGDRGAQKNSRNALRQKDAVIVDAMNPHVTVQVADQPGLREVADDTAHQLIPPPRRTSCGGSSRSSD